MKLLHPADALELPKGHYYVTLIEGLRNELLLTDRDVTACAHILIKKNDAEDLETQADVFDRAITKYRKTLELAARVYNAKQQNKNS